MHIAPTGYLPTEVNGGATATPSNASNAVLNTPNQAAKTSGELTMAAKGGQPVYLLKVVQPNYAKRSYVEFRTHLEFS